MLLKIKNVFAVEESVCDVIVILGIAQCTFLSHTLSFPGSFSFFVGNSLGFLQGNSVSNESMTYLQKDGVLILLENFRFCQTFTRKFVKPTLVRYILRRDFWTLKNWVFPPSPPAAWAGEELIRLKSTAPWKVQKSRLYSKLLIVF